MTAKAVIEEIKQLPHAEQTRVIQFALELARKRQSSGDASLLSPEELGELAKQMVESEILRKPRAFKKRSCEDFTDDLMPKIRRNHVPESLLRIC